jgi:hypothetical protein
MPSLKNNNTMPKEIKIELLGFDRKSIDRSIPVPAGISISMTAVGAKSLDAATASAILTFVFGVSVEVTGALLAHFIIKYFGKNRPKHIKINRKEVIFDEGEIARVISEEIDIQQ